MKRKQGLPTYTRTSEPLWNYSWFHPLLKILLHNWTPPRQKSLDPPLGSMFILYVCREKYVCAFRCCNIHNIYWPMVSSWDVSLSYDVVINKHRRICCCFFKSKRAHIPCSITRMIPWIVQVLFFFLLFLRVTPLNIW